MHCLIITSHPYRGSFAAGLAQNLRQALLTRGHSVAQIDLVADGFNPVMAGEDLREWGKGQYVDTLVGQYKTELQKAELLIIPFPVWWGGMPAILKGFFDKVFLPGFAYKYGEKGELIGLMKDKKALVVSTMETPNEVFNSYFGNPVEGALLKDTLGTCGIEVIQHFALDKIVSGGREAAEAKMDAVIAFVKSL